MLLPWCALLHSLPGWLAVLFLVFEGVNNVQCSSPSSFLKLFFFSHVFLLFSEICPYLFSPSSEFVSFLTLTERKKVKLTKKLTNHLRQISLWSNQPISGSVLVCVNAVICHVLLCFFCNHCVAILK